MTRSEAKLLQGRALAALRTVFGDKVCASGGSIKATSLVLRFEFTTADENAVRENLRDKFRAVASFYFDLDARAFDLPLVVRGESAKLVDVLPRSKKYPFVVKLASGIELKVGAGPFEVAWAKAQVPGAFKFRPRPGKTQNNVK